MKYQFLIVFFMFISRACGIYAQTLLNTSFESIDNYSLGTVHAKNKWTVTNGQAEVVNTVSSVFEGSQALKISSSGSAIQTDNIQYASNASGLSGDVYIDFRINVIGTPSSNLGIIGYDLGTYTNRSFMLELTPNLKIKLYDGSSGWATQPTYALNTWKRISIKIDHTGAKCQYAIDGVVQTSYLRFGK